MNNTLKNTTRGGQIFLHNLRMISQVLNKVLRWIIPFALFASVTYFVLTTPSYSRYLLQQWGWAQFYLFVDNKNHQQIIHLQNGKAIKVYSEEFIRAPFVKEILHELHYKAQKSAYVGGTTYLTLVIITLLWLTHRGYKQSQAKHIKGDYIATVPEIKKTIQQNRKMSRLQLGKEKLSIPLLTEMQHFLFHGTTGSGKSTSIKELLDWIRREGHRAIIYDKSCNLVKQFYTADTESGSLCLDQF